jgi:hypothetical protein
MLKSLALSCQSRQSHWLVFNLKKRPRKYLTLVYFSYSLPFTSFLKIAKRTFQTDKLFRFAFYKEV